MGVLQGATLAGCCLSHVVEAAGFSILFQAALCFRLFMIRVIGCLRVLCVSSNFVMFGWSLSWRQNRFQEACQADIFHRCCGHVNILEDP